MRQIEIAAIVHQYDRLSKYRFLKPPEPQYMLADIFAVLKTRGCAIRVLSDPARYISADIAIMHVDATRVPAAYTELGLRFPSCVNGRVTDISKSVISDTSVERSSDWTGPVIVKTDLNAGGAPERRSNRRARRWYRPPPFPDVGRPYPYRTFPSLADVPPALWDDPDVVVERFVPERLPDGFGMCHYVFCGEYEYCGRFVGTEPIVKGHNVFRNEVIEVPQHIRDRRHALGFDYGKLDFVYAGGQPYLVDANKTPGCIPASGGASLEGMADGLLGLLQKKS